MEQFAVNEFGQPTGLPLHGWWSGRAALPSVPSGGRYCRLERVDAAAHSADLFNAYAEAPDARDWTYLPMERPSGPEAYASWMEGAGRSEDPFFMALLDARSGEALGILAYMRADLANGSIEIGHLNFSGRLKRTPAATEAIYLTMKHAFETLGYRRFEWKCDSWNAPSRRAALRYGFHFEGTFRQAVAYKGRNRDTAWFSMVDPEWPAASSAFEEWLDPSNFGPGAMQLRSLAVIRETLQEARASPTERTRDSGSA